MKGQKILTEVALTKRDYFAGEALRGILANPNPNIKSEMVVEMAMTYADEMMKAIQKRKNDEENLKRIYGTSPKKDDRGHGN
jgi:hypothetical protein